MIAFVDDLPELCDLAKDTFPMDGHIVETFADGVAALKAIEPNVNYFDLIITDHIMPNMGGIEFVRRLRQAEFLGKIIVVSGNMHPDVYQLYERLGVNRVIHKPIAAALMSHIIEELFPH